MDSDEDMYSDDQFEDSDFESEEEEEEEELLSSAESVPTKEEKTTTTSSRKIIIHKESPKAKQKRLNRLSQIYSKVRLTQESFRLYHSPPVKPYDAYMRTINSGNVRQVMTQTNDDARSVRVQTVKSKNKTHAAQIPDDLGFVSTKSSYDLKRFLNASCRTMENILNEKERARRKRERKNRDDDRMIVNSKSFESDGGTRKEVRAVTYDMSLASDNLAIVYVSSSCKSSVEIYSSPSATEPCRVLTSFGEITSCCMCSMYFVAGHEDGTVRLMLRNEYEDEEEKESHCSRVIRVIGIQSSRATMRNFVSLDDRGTILCWTVCGDGMNVVLRKELRLSVSTSTSIPYGPVCEDMCCSDADCILVGMCTGELIRVSQLRDPAPAPRQ
eukprot:g1615.t1